jgi:hypothetical protein
MSIKPRPATFLLAFSLSTVIFSWFQKLIEHEANKMMLVCRTLMPSIFLVFQICICPYRHNLQFGVITNKEGSVDAIEFLRFCATVYITTYLEGVFKENKC